MWIIWLGFFENIKRECLAHAFSEDISFLDDIVDILLHTIYMDEIVQL